jgi:ATP-binding cassette subfamily B (MDR/TAP) protein 1
MKLLFSLLPTRTLLLLVLPAVCFSMVAGGTAPFMTHVIGQNFDAFAAFPLSPNPPDSAKSALLLAVGLVALQLIGLAVATLALSSITSSFWIWIGEYNVKAVRQLVYETVSRKEMVWFDMKTGTEGEVQSTDDKGPLGAGGLMARFAR